MSHSAAAYALFTDALGSHEGTSAWLEIDQARINAFADVTDDHQFIHVDPERAAKETPWGKPIAHGFLTLSLLVRMLDDIVQNPTFIEGLVMGINYGFDKVRFINPVVVNAKIRVSSTYAAVELKGNNILLTRSMTVEIEGETKPALSAQWLTMMVYAD